MMELKVWVDGIQRVVCGVTIETTCQDVVIALAHAMGRTGRFTLIEKWRDVERPLTPAEQPLRVLHKWGEYACEVKLYLCQNDTDKVKQRDRHKQPDRFSHNFSPPKTHADSSIKRNLTFSGPHNVPSLKITHPPSRLQRAGILENGVSPRSSSNSSTSSRSSPHPVPAPRQHSPGNLPRPAPRNSPLLNGQISALPNKPNIRSQPFHPVNTPSNAYLSVSSNFQRPSPPSPNRGRSPSPHTRSSPVSFGQGTSPQRNSPSPSRTKSSVSNSVSPITPVEHNLDGPLNYRRASSEVEEYDLDVNFPDILRDSNSKRPDQPAAHTEYHLEESSDTKPEPERARLLRLVTLQTERLKVQESQLDVIETEIVSLEAKELEYEQDLKRITDDLVELEQRDHDEEVEIADLSSVQWVEVLGQQQQAEKKISSEINELTQKLVVLETKVSLQKEKASELEKEVEKAKKEKEEKELEAARAREEEDKKTVEDQQQLRTELELLVGKHQKEEEELLKITKEVTEVQEGLKVKETELADLEADLKKVNLEDFGTQSLSPTHGKPAETGEAVLKILEGRLSPRPQVTQTTPTQQAFINSLASKNPNGVWV